MFLCILYLFVSIIERMGCSAVTLVLAVAVFTYTRSHIEEVVKSVSSSAPELSSITLGNAFALPVLSSYGGKYRSMGQYVEYILVKS